MIVDKQARALVQLAAVDAGGVGQLVAAHVERHDQLLQRGVAGPLPDAVDRDLHLAGPVLHRGQGVGHGQPQVVVAVHGEHRLVHAGHPFPDAPDELAELRGDGVAHRVGDVDGGGPGPDDLLDQAAQEVELAAAGVLGAELHLVRPLAGVAHGPHGHLHHLVGLLLELVLHVDRRAGQEGVDAAPLGRAEGLGGRLQVLLHAAGQRGDGRALDLLGDQAAGLAAGGARRWESRPR